MGLHISELVVRSKCAVQVRMHQTGMELIAVFLAQFHAHQAVVWAWTGVGVSRLNLMLHQPGALIIPGPFLAPFRFPGCRPTLAVGFGSAGFGSFGFGSFGFGSVVHFFLSCYPCFPGAAHKAAGNPATGRISRWGSLCRHLTLHA